MSDPITRLNAALEGRYRIERRLGEGGMATVYLADDLKHMRKVALKVLKPDLAAAIGVDRFLAEIKTTANLQHPHILPLFDSGEADGLVFYVMPYVGDESLRERLDREHQLPVEDAVRIATNVAEALDYAHRRGVIHRDVKPANILLQDGKPVVSDFGIALAVAGGGGRLTETGLSLGTPHYMSPEQATGDQTVGPATDIYALGCVLYEMLVGEPPYTGSTPQAILGKIIQSKPVSATEVRKTVPVNVDAVIRRSLEKVPADRFLAARDFVGALGDPMFRHRAGYSSSSDSPPTVHTRLSKLMVATSAILAIAVVTLLLTRPGQQAPPVAHFTIPLGSNGDIRLGGETSANGRPTRTALAFSPAGDLLVYAATEAGVSRLYRRRIDQPVLEPLPGTEGASVPIFSPDGAWVAFWVGESLKRISMTSGAIETIVNQLVLSSGPAGSTDLINRAPRGGSWGDDGSIVLADQRRLYHVSAAGGDPRILATAEPVRGQRMRFGQPNLLPGGEALLVQVSRSLNPEDDEILAVDVASGTMTKIIENASDPHYVPTGYLLFARQGTIMAAAFDVHSLSVVGEPVSVVDDVMHASHGTYTTSTGASQIALSESGHLAYARGGVFPEIPRQVVRLTDDGDTTRIDLPAHGYQRVRVSPSGDRLVLASGVGDRQDIYVHDLARGVTRVVDAGGYRNSYPDWSPDGESIVFSSDRDDAFLKVFTLELAGRAEPARVDSSDTQQFLSSWSPSGAIVYHMQDIVVASPGERPIPFVTGDGRQYDAHFSNDGGWIVYTSDESGQEEVYVRPFPGPGAVTLLSRAGGANAMWSPDDKRIFYREPCGPGCGVLMVVDVTLGDGFRATRPETWIDSWPVYDNQSRPWDLFPDGSLVFVLQGEDTGSSQPRVEVAEVHVVLNWFEQLNERMVGN